MENFTPVSGFLGGLLIGCAASLLIVFSGRIAGISGILAGAMGPIEGERPWRLAFVAGLVLGPLAVGVVASGLPTISLQAQPALLALAGLLVGFGTRLGSGCTSGHGVCGMVRGSPRSIAATAVFFAVALATVFITRHAIGG